MILPSINTAVCRKKIQRYFRKLSQQFSCNNGSLLVLVSLYFFSFWIKFFHEGWAKHSCPEGSEVYEGFEVLGKMWPAGGKCLQRWLCRGKWADTQSWRGFHTAMLTSVPAWKLFAAFGLFPTSACIEKGFFDFADSMHIYWASLCGDRLFVGSGDKVINK